MLRNYLKVAIRNLLKYRFYSLINVLGLAVGICCVLFISLYIQDELSYDKHFPEVDHIYRVDFAGKIGSREWEDVATPPALGPTLQADFPEVSSFVRMRSFGDYFFRYQDKGFTEDDVIFADSTMLSMFGLKVLRGDAKTALRDPNSAVITASTAKKYFGDADPIGQVLTAGEPLNTDFAVRAVIEDHPANQHFQHDIFLSFSTSEESRSGDWGSFNNNTYIRLKNPAEKASIEARFPDMVKTYFAPIIEGGLGLPFEEFLAQGYYVDFSLFPVTDIHLYSDKSGELEANGDIRYVYIFGIIGLFILLIACINFMNLSTARSAGRAREVGVRKVIGAGKASLILQFLSESLLISFFAFVLAVSAMQLLLPWFNDLAGKSLQFDLLYSGGFFALVLMGIVTVGLLAGSYPALVLSRFQPIKVLKGGLAMGMKDGGFRSGLVVIQFTVTTALIIGTMVVYKQLGYIQNKKLGFEKDQLLVIEETYAIKPEKALLLKQRFSQLNEVEAVSVSGFIPVDGEDTSTGMFAHGQSTSDAMQIVHYWAVDHDYIKTMDMEVLLGRDFDINLASDSQAVILNEAAVNIFQLRDPLEAVIGRHASEGYEMTEYPVIGVVKDFHFQSLRSEIAPMVLHLGQSQDHITIRAKSSDMSSLVSQVEQIWTDVIPLQPLSWSFMDKRFDEIYEVENQIGTIIQLFAFLAIFIACLGLLGLATFTAIQRTKEIGIRKVLGASIPDLFFLLTKDFSKWLMMAFGLGALVAWYVLGKWLEEFEYATNLGWEVFFLTAILLFLIAFATISFQSLRVAFINPTQSLKHE
ncbi:MAG: ABC transporter permease [Bacteroidota bacterium]